MKLLRVKATGFKGCCDGITIDLVAKQKKTAEDKEYELQEIADGLYVFNTMALIGKNASGKTTILQLLDCAYSILGDFQLGEKHYEYDGAQVEITFFHQGFLYRYETRIQVEGNLKMFTNFQDEKIYRKEYFKTSVNNIFKLEK